MAEDVLEFRWRDVQFLRGQVMSPDDAMQAALDTAAPPRYVCASEYISVIAVLRDEKGLTWKEVGEWFAEKKLPFSLASLQAAYFKYRHRPSLTG
jgi:hypothetical protein